jgi:hypothetical protein
LKTRKKKLIFLDSSETRSTSTMPDIPSSQAVNGLEEMTGADMMISPLEAPVASEALIKVHLSKGAQLVQVKRGLDLTSSLGERMNFSLSKMRSIGARQSQCVLLFVGVLTCDAQGNALVNGRDTGRQFMHVQSAIEGWSDRGGVVTFLPRASLISEWCRMRSRRLKKYQGAPERTSYPDSIVLYEDAPLQLVQPVRDARKTLVTLPGIGEERANMLWGAFGERAGDILIWLTHPVSPETRIKGIGDGTIDSIREYLGLDPVYTLGYDLCDILVERMQKKEKE